MLLAVTIDPGRQLGLPEHVGLRQLMALQVGPEVVGGAEAVAGPHSCWAFWRSSSARVTAATAEAITDWRSRGISS